MQSDGNTENKELSPSKDELSKPYAEWPYFAKALARVEECWADTWSLINAGGLVQHQTELARLLADFADDMATEETGCLRVENERLTRWKKLIEACPEGARAITIDRFLQTERMQPILLEWKKRVARLTEVIDSALDAMFKMGNRLNLSAVELKAAYPAIESARVALEGAWSRSEVVVVQSEVDRLRRVLKRIAGTEDPERVPRLQDAVTLRELAAAALRGEEAPENGD
jgi:hypothetical protein